MSTTSTAEKLESGPKEQPGLRLIPGGDRSWPAEGGGEPPGPIRVLIVDDDEGDYVLTRDALARAAMESVPTWESTPDGALAAIVANAPDVCLVDYRLGPECGVDLIRRIRDAGCEAPLIMLAGTSGREVDLEAMNAGASDFLSKDEVTPRLLERTIRYAMGRRRSAARLLASQRRYEAAVAGSNDGIWDWDLVADRIYLSPRWGAMLGLELSDLDANPAAWRRLVHDDDRTLVDRAFEDHLDGGTALLCAECRMQHRDGSWLWMYIRGVAQRSADGTPRRLAGSITDITDRKLREQEATRRSLHDPLTGLANRDLLLDRVEHAVQRVRRDSSFAFSLLYLDLDGFKAVNDTHGHTAGDIVLGEVAARLNTILRGVDCVARVGGDEFVVVLDGCDRPENASVVCEKVREAIEVPIELPDALVSVSASIGSCVVTDGTRHAGELVGAADRAMYEVKHSARAGRQLRVLDGGQAPCSSSQDQDFRTALDTDAIAPHFQPILDLRIGSTVGFEALARWSHPTRGMVSPAEFIPIAERTGMVTELGRQMLLKACAWAAAHGGGAWVSVNVSATHVLHRQFEEHVDAALAASGLPPQWLRLELTEHASLVDAPMACRALGRLSERGVGIDLDDFGTGYSSIDLLFKLPVDAIKLDRALIAGIHNEPAKARVVEGLVGMAHGLHLSVVAEGVETREERNAVVSQRIDLVQGYLFGRPEPRGFARVA